MKRRVVVTGIGTINPLAQSVDETYDKLLAGVSAVDTITSFDVSDFSTKFAAQIKGFNPKEHIDRKEVKRLDIYAIYALVAAKQAFKDAGLEEGGYIPEKSGCILGSGIGGMATFEDEAKKLFARGPRRISPHFIPKMISNAASAQVAIAHNLKSINFNCVSACASANHAMGESFRDIQYGHADLIATGGAEAAISPLALAGFCSMKALSTRNDDPKTASRPFDKDRDGFVMGEGSGILIFEELEHAKARGAKIYAEVIGSGASCDAFHITAPAEGGEGGVRAIRSALHDAQIEPNEVNYYNAHGTSTPYNDKFETIAVKTVFGDYAKKLLINSTKSMIGHALGAAAALEAIACIKAIETGKLHPTINIVNPDPECDLNYIPNKAIEAKVDICVSNSLGFGGHNGVMVFKRFA